MCINTHSLYSFCHINAHTCMHEQTHTIIYVCTQNVILVTYGTPNHNLAIKYTPSYN